MSKERLTREELLAENRRLRASLDRARESDAGAGEPPADAASSLFRKAFRRGPVALFVSRLSDGVCLEANEQFTRSTGYERSELVGHSSEELEAMQAPERLRRVVKQRLRAEGKVLNVEFRLRDKGGRLRWMLGSCRRLQIGGDDCMLLSCVDVTERRHGEASREEGKELFQRVFRLSPAGLVLTRLSDGRFVDVNPELCRLTGYEREELVGRSSLQAGLWKGNEARRKELVSRLNADGVVHDFELTLNTRANQPVSLLGSFQALSVGGEELILGVLSDLTARKRTEQSLRQAKREAERAHSKTQEVAQFRSSVIANMTHEVRTPLTVILGFTSILREGVDPTHRRFVDLIERSGRRLLMTLDSVLDLAQLESGTLEVNARPHNLLDVVDSVASTVRTLATEKGLQFEIELPEHALYARVDYELLSRALNHLLDNAIKFTDEGKIILRVRSGEENVFIEVEDTGIGIAQEFVSELFDTFSQESSGIERDYQGSGMGLAVAARLVRSFDGQIRVESEKDVGSTFAIVFPKVELATKGLESHARVA